MTDVNKDKKLEGGLRVKMGASYKKNDAAVLKGAGDMLASVITITYNGAAHIEHTIKSVLAQSYKNIEYIVVDGGSTDGTLDIIKKYEDRIDYWVSEKDRGISDAMNKGVELATGAIVGMIHADDWYEPDAVENAVKTFAETGAGVVCADLRYHKDGVAYFIGRSDPDSLDKTMSVWHPTVFVRAGIYKSAGAFELKYISGMDYDLLLRFSMKGVKIAKDDKIYANMRAGGTSDQSWRRMIREEYLIKTANGIGVFKAYAYYLGRYAYFAAAAAFKKTLAVLGLTSLMPLLKKIRNKFDKRFIDN
ncbi:MAG: hypothetical protein A2008_12250 [Candidatus Wallbacteria bacterium GWC2_49_35]|uniref:Glycosyltransferase 2-like domain-containing protein n=1 Tax=Candidatus Wallbacteria bacterium GWC2_49_35 TaxID=1817813 RepID=A0A1F7WTF4_9BACT|nr:MAG: hypothetical protein A2008_12250 [Candidatus Wallbacteria bacterium GWC2_49_35]